MHGTNTASPTRLDRAPNDALLGNQLCQWSSIGTTESSYLQVISLFTSLALVPMSLPTINLILVSSPTPLWPVPIHRPIISPKYASPIMGSEIALSAARNSALAGHVPSDLIPFFSFLQHGHHPTPSQLDTPLPALRSSLRPTTSALSASLMCG